MTRTILRRLGAIEEARRLYSAAYQGTSAKELLLAKLERVSKALKNDPTWIEPSPAVALESRHRLREFFETRGWHSVAQTILNPHSAVR